MKNQFAFILSIGLAAPAFAHSGHGLFALPGVLEAASLPKDGPCAKVNLSKDQREKLKALYFKTKESILEAEAELNKIGLNGEKLFNDEKATLAAAEALTKASVASHSKMLEAMSVYSDQTYFSILKPDQRGAAQLCEKMMTINEMFEGHPDGRMFHGGFERPELHPRRGPPPDANEKADPAKGSR